VTGVPPCWHQEPPSATQVPPVQTHLWYILIPGPAGDDVIWLFPSGEHLAPAAALPTVMPKTKTVECAKVIWPDTLSVLSKNSRREKTAPLLFKMSPYKGTLNFFKYSVAFSGDI